MPSESASMLKEGEHHVRILGLVIGGLGGLALAEAINLNLYLETGIALGAMVLGLELSEKLIRRLPERN